MADVATCLTDFLERVEPLPAEIRRSLSLVQQLDTGSQEMLAKLKEMQDEYIRKTRRRMQERGMLRGPMYRDQAALAAIGRVRREATQKADTKIACTAQAYDLVDSHIRRLDKDIARYEKHLRASGLWTDPGAEAAEAPKVVKRGRKTKAAGTAGAGAGAGAATVADQSLVQMVDDAPIDPNEPLYCICHRVAFGGMVGCDNDDCAVEWFHYSCVGLTEQPKGKWYCPTCRETMPGPKKKRQRKR